MNNKKNVLIFPANSPDVYHSLKSNLHFEVYGAIGREDHSKYIFPSDKYIATEKLFITDSSFLDNLNELISEWKIDFIVPTHDTIAYFLMKNQEQISAKIVCSPVETTRIAENKLLMYELLRDKEYYPAVYEKDAVDMEYPVFLKPYVAAGGKGTVKVNSREELLNALEKNSELLICEYLPGEECTVDCFTNKDGELLFVGPRTRGRITNGVTHKSERIPLTDEIYNIAKDLNSKLVFRGAWFFQLKKDINGKYKFMEFSVRQAGTMSFYRQLGVNFALLSLFDFMDMPVKILYNDLDLKLDRGIETLYDIAYEYDAVYLDYDDTLIVNDKVNVVLLQVIYQAYNKGRKVYLLTKHIGDLEESFAKYHLAKEMFDEIILIEPKKKKADYIKHQRAVFIDNYFPERLQVKETLGIPVFDVDAVECLVDYR